MANPLSFAILLRCSCPGDSLYSTTPMKVIKFIALKIFTVITLKIFYSLFGQGFDFA